MDSYCLGTEQYKADKAVSGRSGLVADVRPGFLVRIRLEVRRSTSDKVQSQEVIDSGRS